MLDIFGLTEYFCPLAVTLYTTVLVEMKINDFLFLVDVRLQMSSWFPVWTSEVHEQ